MLNASGLVQEMRESDRLAVLMYMLPAVVITLVEVSSNIIIPTTFSNDWISLLGYLFQTIRQGDTSSLASESAVPLQ